MLSGPCKDCEERELGCHSHCIAYKKFRAEIDEISEKKRKQIEMEIFSYKMMKNRVKTHSSNLIRSQKV